MDLSQSFKRGSPYTRASIWEICRPGEVRSSGGNWYTGYSEIDNNLIVFMNIGVSGRTGHDFDNYYDEKTGIITWYGKPNSHAGQPTFQRLFSEETIPHFFARWDSKDTNFVYLGTGSIITHRENVQTKNGPALEMKLLCDDARDVIHHYSTSEQLLPESQPSIATPSSFALEKHLEEYLYRNWSSTIFGDRYQIHENGKQYPTDTGPIDLLAVRNDHAEFLVVELKRDKANDVAVGQTLRYMGYIKANLATRNEDVKGCIIGTEEDQGLRNALTASPSIDFYRYKINFSVERLQL